MSRSAEVGLATLCGLVVVAATGTETLATVVILSALLIASLVVTRFRTAAKSGRAGTDRLATAFAVAWVALVLGPVHQFSHRPIADALQAPGVESLTEFLYFGGAGVLAVVTVRAVGRDLGSAIVPAPLFALPVFAMLSFLWSPIYFYSFGRGLQFTMTAILAWGTANVGMADPQFLRAVLERFGRWFIRVVIVLVLLGVAFGPVFVGASEENKLRFTWIGTHPLGAAFVAGLALVAIVALPSHVTKLRGATKIVALGIVGYAEYGAQGRTALVALAAAVGYLLANAVRKSAVARYVSLPYALAALTVAAFYFREQLLEYFYRGDTADEVASGNGRSELWSDAYRLLETPFDWAFGLGYGSSRQVFLPGKPWAKSAHSSVLGILVNLGIIGLVCLTMWIGYTVIMALKARLYDNPMGNALVALLVYSIVHAIAAETISYPGTGNSIVMLVAASAVAAVRSPVGGWPRLTGPPAGARGSPADSETRPGPVTDPRSAMSGRSAHD